MWECFGERAELRDRTHSGVLPPAELKLFRALPACRRSASATAACAMQRWWEITLKLYSSSASPAPPSRRVVNTALSAAQVCSTARQMKSGSVSTSTSQSNFW